MYTDAQRKIIFYVVALIIVSVLTFIAYRNTARFNEPALAEPTQDEVHDEYDKQEHEYPAS